MNGADSLRAHFDALVAEQEAGRSPPWSPADAPAKFIATMMTGIVGFNIEIERLEGKFKLGQNRSAEDRAGVIQGLAGEDGAGAVELAEMIRK